MKKLRQMFHVLLLASVGMLAACHSEEVRFDMDTFGQVNLASVQMTAETEPLVTASRVAADMGDYLIAIYTESGELVEEWKYSEMPELFTLQTGRYTVYAHSPEVEGAAFDAPCCASDAKSFEIRQDEITEIGELKCTLTSIKVTVEYDEKLFSLLGDDVTVTVSVGGELLSFAKDEGRSGFFHGESESNIVDVRLQGTIEGEEASISKSYGDIAPGTELIVTFSLMESIVGIDPGTGGTPSFAGAIKISNELISVNENVSLLPEEDGILDFGNPKIEGDGFDIALPITNLDQQVVVNLTAPEGIQHVYVGIYSDNEGFAGVIAEMFPVNPFDLSYPGELETALTNLGLPVGEEVIDQQLVKFDVSEFIPLLKGDFAGMHRFELEVVDNNGMSVKATLSVDSRNAK